MRLSGALAVLSAGVLVAANKGLECRCFPGDECWPDSCEWSSLNATVDGRLIKTVPLGTPCHEPHYDAAACQVLKDEWLFSAVHMNSSSSVMAPIFANQSCDPFTSPDTPCSLGYYVSYAVNVSKPEHIQETLKFAKKHNIRFVIRNTGHDYNGRSTGAGGLAVWTHNLKSTEVVDWHDAHYKGKALKIGAGIQGFEALAAAAEAGLAVVTGECPTVGLAGGYVQGAGHSGLSTNFGLGADNALAYDVVTPEGDFIHASPFENEDIYWALSGGGGGNWGIVYSMAVRAHPDAMVSGAKFTLDIPANKPDKLYKVIEAFHDALPAIVDQGVMIIYFFGPGFFESPAMTAYGKTREEVTEIFKPLKKSLAKLGVAFSPNITQFPSYYDHFQNYWGPLPSGNIQVGTTLFGGRLIPRKALPNFQPTAKKLIELGVTFIGVGLNVEKFGKNSVNAVLPQWRSSIIEASLTLPWSFDVPFEQMAEVQRNITNIVQPVVEAGTPGSGAYMNEADFQQRDFQDAFYGANYKKLLKIKHKYDPDYMLYVQTGVGSEDWEVLENGRLCKVGPHDTTAGFPS